MYSITYGNGTKDFKTTFPTVDHSSSIKAFLLKILYFRIQ
jgi:hypothetical protein